MTTAQRSPDRSPEQPAVASVRATNDLRGHLQVFQAEGGIGAIPLRSLMQRPLQVFEPATSLRDVLVALNGAGADAGLVAQQLNQPLGIASFRELVEAITVQHASLDDPVISCMIGAPVSLPADASAHRAKILLTRSRSRHLLALEQDGRVAGLLSQAEIPGYREGGADLLADRIQAARTTDDLVCVARDVRRRGAELFAAGMGVEALCHWTSGLNDLLSLRVIELVADTFDLPAIPWCWLVFGSEGRLEQTFTTDQDNGLVFLPGDGRETDCLRQLFLPFAATVNQALDRCGFDLCRGKIMAGNAQWCLSLEEWQEKFRQWIEIPEPDAVLNSTIFFDFRPLYGQDELADRLRQWLLPLPERHPRFLHCLAQQALGCTPACGLFGRFRYDGGREHPHTIDLKLHGIRPFVDAARIWALRYQVWATSTADRLRSVTVPLHRSVADTAAAVASFDLVQRIRIQQQLSCTQDDLANWVDPRQLHELQKLSLKEAFAQAKLLQTRLREDFTGQL
ncbi:MAG: hypothetical protein BWK76_22875 [Desulfobulbaceae bacterium A2]|nr:MAG: hypothetical protein BWK76_22875 [Desulfobulbaceae bacterium A2]